MTNNVFYSKNFLITLCFFVKLVYKKKSWLCWLAIVFFHASALNATMYIGVKGGIISFKADKITAVGRGSITTNGPTVHYWPNARQNFEVVKNEGEHQYNFAGLVGYSLSNFNIELEGGISSLDFATDANNLSQYSLYRVTPFYGMLNAYASFQNFTPVSPYVGAGVGATKAFYDVSNNQTPPAKISASLTSSLHSSINNFLKIFEEKINTNQIIFQFSTGVNIAMTRSLVLTVDYRVFNKLSDLKFAKDSNKSIFISSPYKHTVIGASIKFTI